MNGYTYEQKVEIFKNLGEMFRALDDIGRPVMIAQDMILEDITPLKWERQKDGKHAVCSLCGGRIVINPFIGLPTECPKCGHPMQNAMIDEIKIEEGE